MELNDMVATLESYIIRDDNFGIATEGFNLKQKIKDFAIIVKNFFIGIFNKIRNWVVSSVFKGTQVNPKYFDEFEKAMQEDSAIFKNMVDDSMKEINDLLNKYSKNGSIDNLSERDKLYLENDMWKNQKFLTPGETYRRNSLSNSSIDFDAATNSLSHKKENLQYISRTDISKVEGYIKTFQSEGDRFERFVSSLNISESDFNVYFKIYTNITKSGMHHTSQYMRYLDKILVKPKSTSETIDLGGSFKVIPQM